MAKLKGFGIDVVIADDPLEPEKVESEAYRKKAKDFYYKSVNTITRTFAVRQKAEDGIL